MPPESPAPLLSAKEIIAKSSPVEATTAISDKERELEAAKLILAHTPEGCQVYAANLEYHKSVETTLAKLKKQQPCPKVFAEQLRSAKQAQLVLKSKFQEKVEAGKAKAAGRLMEQLKAIDSLTAALHERRTACISEHAKVTDRWAAFNQKRYDQHQQVLSQFDAMILTAELPDSPPAMMDTDQGASGTVHPPGTAMVPTPTEDALLQAQRAAAVANEALAKLQKQFQEAQQAQPQPGVPPELVTFVCENDELPEEIPEPEPDQWEAYHILYSALDTLGRHDALAGPPIPVTYGQIKCGLAVPRQLLGDALWAKAYPSGNVSDDTIVTQQIRALMVQSIKQHQAKLIKDKAKHDANIKAAKADMDVIASDARAKKRKTSAASAAGA